jgi:ABC-type bacteriocin/lantibiotic exporter with double-glycine peptidase domain
LALSVAVISGTVLLKRSFRENIELSRSEGQTDLQPQANCGVACVAYLSAYYGRAETIKSLPKISAPYLNNGAITLEGLQRVCENSGFKGTQALHVDVEDLGAIPAPFIVHLNDRPGGHFMICAKVGPVYIQLIDMTTVHFPIKSVTASEFRPRFSGYVLVVSPPKEM